MAEYRKYDRKTKLAVVMAADMVGVVQAEKQSGIPESTIRYWMEKPEFAEFRAKTREDLEAEVSLVAHLALRRVAQTIDTMEPRDALFAMEKATTLMLLTRGEATTRTETKDITHDLDNETRQKLTAWIDRRVDTDAGATDSVPAGVGAEVREPAAG